MSQAIMNMYADALSEITRLKTELNKARRCPCEWCVSTTEQIESLTYENEELKEKING